MCLDQFGKFPKDMRVSSNIYGMLVLHREQLFYQNLHWYTFIKSPQNVAPLCSNMEKNGFVLKSLFIQLNKYIIIRLDATISFQFTNTTLNVLHQENL